MTAMRTSAKTERGERQHRRTVALGKVDTLMTVLAMLVLGGGYSAGLLSEALAVVLLATAILTAASRVRPARHSGLEYGLLRHPLRRDVRPHLLQCVNHWLFWTTVGAAILVGSFSNVPGMVALLFGWPLLDVFPYRPLVILLGIAALVTSALMLVPRRRVPIASNVLVAIGSVLLAVQLAGIGTPPDDPVAVDLPLSGDWAMLAGGRSALLSHHHLLPSVSNAVDFVRLVDGRGYRGDAKRADSWHGFGEPVLAPADGTVVRVLDGQPDEPVGAIGQTLGQEGNHIVVEIGARRYAVLAHLRQGSVRVRPGDRVRRGQQIAAVGDSGNSLAPHLHFHIQDHPDSGDQVRTLPVVFRDVVLTRGEGESTPASADLRRGDHVRRIGS